MKLAFKIILLLLINCVTLKSFDIQNAGGSNESTCSNDSVKGIFSECQKDKRELDSRHVCLKGNIEYHASIGNTNFTGKDENKFYLILEYLDKLDKWPICNFLAALPLNGVNKSDFEIEKISILNNQIVIAYSYKKDGKLFLSFRRINLDNGKFDNFQAKFCLSNAKNVNIKSIENTDVRLQQLNELPHIQLNSINSLIAEYAKESNEQQHIIINMDIDYQEISIILNPDGILYSFTIIPKKC